MATKLQLLGARIRHFDVRLRDANTICRIDFSVDLTQPLADKLQCPEAKTGDHYKRMNLTIDEIPLEALHLVKEGLENHSLEIVAQKAKDFIAVRKQEEEAGPVERELRFHVFAPGEACALVQAYLAAIGEGRGALTLTLGPEQQSLQ